MYLRARPPRVPLAELVHEFVQQLAQARNDGVDLERASAMWSTSSFTSYKRPATLAGRAVGWGVAIEIERGIKTSAHFC